MRLKGKVDDRLRNIRSAARKIVDFNICSDGKARKVQFMNADTAYTGADVIDKRSKITTPFYEVETVPAIPGSRSLFIRFAIISLNYFQRMMQYGLDYKPVIY